MIILNKEDAEKAIYGGCILGGGGGGWIKEGLEKIETTFQLGQPKMVQISELQDDDYATCVSLVGAPSAKDAYIHADQLVQTVERMQKEFKEPVKALITNENGAAATINGWLQSVTTGLPILDAPCNGRAHPTGTMGSLNLTEIDGYTSIQTFAGGKGHREVEGVVRANLDKASEVVRDVSVKAGGMVGVCRNPVSIRYLKENAAVGGISQAIELGEVFLAEKEGFGRIEAVVEYLGGEIIHSGVIEKFELKASDGFDVGLINVGNYELTIWNEYMTIEKDGERIGTFPDLIMTFDTKTGMPLISAEIKERDNITIINVRKEKLKLSTTMYNEKLLKVIEPIINRKIV